MNVALSSFKPATPLFRKEMVVSFMASHGVSGLGSQYVTRQQSVANLVKQWTPDLLFFGGDNVWPGPTDNNSSLAWDPWLDEIANEIVFPAVGVTENSAGFPISELQRFTYLPAPRTRYAVITPLATFYVVNTEIDQLGVDEISDQKLWLDEMLEASTTHWNIVIQYRAGFTSDAELTPGSLKSRWTSTNKYVDLVLCGQPKQYERLAIPGHCPIINAGISGTPPDAFAATPVDGSIIRRTGLFGAVRLHIDAETLEVSAFDSSGEFPTKFDSLIIRKEVNRMERMRAFPART